MKTNNLRNTLENLKLPPVNLSRHQRLLKQALIQYEAPKHTLAHTFRTAIKNILGVPMAHKKLFASFSSLSVLALLAIGITTYNFNHSPRAEAEQLVKQGIGFVHTFNNDEMSKLQAQLGGDPVAALEEAKAADDLEVITKAEFDAEATKHKGIAMSSLGTDGPQYGAIGIGVTDGGLPPNPPEGGNVHYSTGGPVEGGSVRMEDGNVVKGEFNSAVERGDNTPPDKVLEYHAAANATTPGQPETGPPNFTPVTPSKYLRYTNNTGHVVVLGLDDKGVPINKTIFMNDDEVQNLPKPKLDSN